VCVLRPFGNFRITSFTFMNIKCLIFNVGRNIARNSVFFINQKNSKNRQKNNQRFDVILGQKYLLFSFQLIKQKRRHQMRQEQINHHHPARVQFAIQPFLL